MYNLCTAITRAENFNLEQRLRLHVIKWLWALNFKENNLCRVSAKRWKMVIMQWEGRQKRKHWGKGHRMTVNVQSGAGDSLSQPVASRIHPRSPPKRQQMHRPPAPFCRSTEALGLQFLREIPLRFLAGASEQPERKLQRALRLFGEHFRSLCRADWTLLQCKHQPSGSSPIRTAAGVCQWKAALGCKEVLPGAGADSSPLQLQPAVLSWRLEGICCFLSRELLIFSAT